PRRPRGHGSRAGSTEARTRNSPDFRDLEGSSRDVHARPGEGVPVRTVVIGGSTLLLLLIGAAFVGHRRSPDAVAPPASLTGPDLSDRPPDDLHHLRVRGFVGSDTVVSPAALPLAALSPGRTVERLVTVRPPPGRERTPVEARLVGLLGETRVVEGPLLRATG